QSMSSRHGLLALLERGPRHGYQLRAEFDAATGATWPLNVGQVYTTLDRLQRGGFVIPDGAARAAARSAAPTPTAGSPTGSPTPAEGRSGPGSPRRSAPRRRRATSWPSSSHWRSPR